MESCIRHLSGKRARCENNVSFYLQKKTGRVCRDTKSLYKRDGGLEVRGDKNGGQTWQHIPFHIVLIFELCEYATYSKRERF